MFELLLLFSIILIIGSSFIPDEGIHVRIPVRQPVNRYIKKK